ncbi:hypothetical protein [Sedimentimonas flavescens]|uniref:hypothetical protein n=1 Tax=Sedimentimonas flavescens TaxID=2851012 RepID=UPI0021A6481B|nr:hypothetical protein [Sedimentimonas flavescens]MCT2538758.1 hypothetical protein [Sedimentimonas flavescens]
MTMQQNIPPKFDETAQTEFLKRTLARAMTERALKRAVALKQMEVLLGRVARGQTLGVQGFLLSSIAREYPVSHRAMDLELRGKGPQGLVEVAEQIELKLWVAR